MFVMALLLSLAVLPSLAQGPIKTGFAGDDINVLLEPTPGNTVKVYLGKGDNAPNCLYKWKVYSSPPSSSVSINNTDVPCPQVTIGTIGEYVFEETRVSIYGYQREYVKVNVCDEVNLMTAVCKKDCFEREDLVLIENFDIKTMPEGFEYLVRIHPDDAEVGANEFGYTDIRFQIRKSDGSYQDCEEEGEIWVAPGDWGDFSIEMGKIKDVKDEWKKIKRYKNQIMNADKKFEKFKNIALFVREFTGPVAPIEPDHHVEFNLGASIRNACCDDESRWYLSVQGNFDCYAGFKVNVPLWPGVPKCGLLLTGGAGIGCAANPDLQLGFNSCCNLSFTADAYGKIQLGLTLAALDPDILSVTPSIGAEVHGETEFSINPPKISFNGLYVQGGFKVDIVFIGFNKELVSFKTDPLYIIDGE